MILDLWSQNFGYITFHKIPENYDCCWTKLGRTWATRAPSLEKSDSGDHFEEYLDEDDGPVAARQDVSAYIHLRAPRRSLTHLGSASTVPAGILPCKLQTAPPSPLYNMQAMQAAAPPPRTQPNTSTLALEQLLFSATLGLVSDMTG